MDVFLSHIVFNLLEREQAEQEAAAVTEDTGQRLSLVLQRMAEVNERYH